MTATIVCVLIGIGIGLLDLPQAVQRFFSLVQKYIVYVLIFFMGIGIGLNDDLITNIGRIGIGAAVFALFCGLLSAVCTQLFVLLLKKERKHS